MSYEVPELCIRGQVLELVKTELVQSLVNVFHLLEHPVSQRSVGGAEGQGLARKDPVRVLGRHYAAQPEEQLVVVCALEPLGDVLAKLFLEGTPTGRGTSALDLGSGFEVLPVVSPDSSEERFEDHVFPESQSSVEGLSTCLLFCHLSPLNLLLKCPYFYPSS